MYNHDQYWCNDFNGIDNDPFNDITDNIYYRYFNNLANNKDFHSLLQFSKQYICDEIKAKIINIYGDTSSGKSLLLTLLNKYVKSTTLKVTQLNKHILHHFNGRYIIVEVNDEPMYEYMNIIKEFTRNTYQLDNYTYDADYKFVFLSKTKLPNYFSQYIHYVGLENKFNNSNIEFLLTEDLQALRDFILQ